MCISVNFNTLTEDKIIALSKLKAFTDNKLNATQNIGFVVHRIKNIQGQGENAV